MAIIALSTDVTRDSMASDVRKISGLLLESQLPDTLLFEVMNTVIDWYRGLGVESIDQHYETEVGGLAYAQAAGQDPQEYFTNLSNEFPTDPLKVRLKDEYGTIHVKTPSAYNNRMDFIRISPESAKRYRLAKITQFNGLRQAAVIYLGSVYTLGVAVTANYPRMPKRPVAGADGLDIPKQIVNPVRGTILNQVYADVLKQPMPPNIETLVKSTFNDWIVKHGIKLTSQERAA